MKNQTTRRLVESAVLIALGFVLSYIKVPVGPNTTISLVSMLPIILLSYKYGVNWGLLCGFIHGLLQMVEGGIDTPPTENFFSYLLVILLDYVLAFTVLGLAGVARRVIKNPPIAISLCCIVGIVCRFVCSFLSGWIIWGVYAPEGQPAWVYSLVVNGTKFGFEGLLTVIVGALLLAIPVMQKYTAPVFSGEKSLKSSA